MVSTTTYSSPFHPQPFHPAKKMSVTQTYYLAHKARAKLSREAAQPDHNLRLLVGHANLLDTLMLDLADAEREQESWFNHSVRGASPKTKERHIQWTDSIPERTEEDWGADSSDSEEDSDDEVDDDVEMADAIPLTRVASHHTFVPLSPQLETMGEDFEEDDEEDYDSLTLTRTPSHFVTSPPELDHDSDSSDDESMPPSPPFAVLPTFSEHETKQREAAVSTTAYYDDHDSKSSEPEVDHKADFYDQGFYLPPRNPARLVSAISVY
jgi:hypothetical protein